MLQRTGIIILLCIIGSFVYGQNVGIGVAVPTAKLEVNGDILATNGYTIGNINPGSRIEYGCVILSEDRATGTWRTITFTQPFTTLPAIFVETNTYNGPEDPNIRIQNVTLTGFQMRFDEQNTISGSGATADGNHIDENVCWIAIGR